MHREIYRASRSRNPVEARKQMEHHLRMAESAQNMELPGVHESHPARPRARKPATVKAGSSVQ
jgi:GntR family transcriptional repressor for pyruvate dehydrogenase complex